MGIVETGNATSASNVVGNSSNPPALGVTRMKSNSCVSRCISTGWDCAASNELAGFTIPLSSTGFEKLDIHASDAPESEEIPEVTDLDELQTFVGNKRNKLWIGCAVNHKQAGILAWVIGDRSAQTFKTLWLIVKCWHCFFYVTDGWKVYPMFIEEGDQIVSKTYMTRVEGENTRLRHYLARLHRKTGVLLQVS